MYKWNYLLNWCIIRYGEIYRISVDGVDVIMWNCGVCFVVGVSVSDCGDW